MISSACCEAASSAFDMKWVRTFVGRPFGLHWSQLVEQFSMRLNTERRRKSVPRTSLPSFGRRRPTRFGRQRRLISLSGTVAESQ